MSYYFHLNTSGTLEGTNLQLYSLQQAAHGWNDLAEEIAYAGVKNVDHLKERLTFIVSCLGLSLSQLLGQNNPFPEAEKVADPGELLGEILKRSPLDRIDRKRLNTEFGNFLPYYAAVRHFGKNQGDANYRLVDELTVDKVDRFRRMTIEIWDVMIGLFRQDSGNELEELDTVLNAVPFDGLND